MDKNDELLEIIDVIDEISKKTFDQTILGTFQNRFESQELYDFIQLRFPGLDDKTEALLAPSVFWSKEKQAIALVIRDFNKDIAGVKYRKLDPQAKPRYLSEPGSVNEGHWIRGEGDKLLIVEGEIDAITAAIAGFKGSILATQTNRLAESQLNAIKGFKHVFICPDKDLGGMELENSCKELLGPLKSIIKVVIPNDSKDLNEYFQKESYEQCSQFIQMATRTELEKDSRSLIQCIPELLTWLSNERNTIGDTTGWKSIDHLLGGGLRASEMSVINAFAKAGKSSFINNLIHNLAKSGKRVALASFEMDPSHVIFPSLVSIAAEMNIRNLDNESRKEIIENAPSDFSYLNNIITLRRFGYTPWEDIEEWAKLMKKTHNIDYLVLDHAGFMVEKMTDAEENQTLAKNIKRLTNELEIHIPVIVQAPKTKDGLSIQTAYGGLAWAMNSDNFFILERDRENENLLKVRLEASRYPGSNPSYTPIHLYYNKDTLTLTE